MRQNLNTKTKQSRGMLEGQKQKKNTFSIGLLVATLVLVAIETLFFLPTIANSRFAFTSPNQWILLIPNNLFYFILYIVIPIIYCSVASLLFQPKKMIHPLHVQFIVFAVVVLMVINNVSITLGAFPNSTNSAMLLLGLSIGFSALFFIAMALMQWFSVRWLIRMNYEDSDRVSYIVDMPTKEILHKLGHSFLDDWSFSRERDIGENWILKREEENYRHLLIELGPHPLEENKSVIATVAFECTNNWIMKSPSASNNRDTLVSEIEKRLKLQFHDKLADLDNTVSRLAESNVKDMAHSRIEGGWLFLRRLSRMFKLMLGLTVALLFVLSIAYFNFNANINMSSDTYIGAIVALLIVLFIEIGFPLREELAKKKREEIDF